MQAKQIIKEFGTAKDFYTTNEKYRDSLEGTWEDCAALTVPYLFQPDSSTEQNQLATPYNSIGSYAVNNLASKLLLALLPPTGTFFRLLPDRELVQGMGPEEARQLDLELSQVERDVIELINTQAIRVGIYEAVKYLIVVGNTMLYKAKDGGIKVFSPKQYVVQRDYAGKVVAAGIKEVVDFYTLPPSVQALVEENAPDQSEGTTERRDVDVHTMIARTSPKSYVVWQEVYGTIIESTIRTYTDETLPYIILRWTAVANENYGRGLVEQYIGDLRSLEGLTQTIVDGSGAAAFQLYGLRPSATTKLEDLANAKNGDIIQGDLEKDITTLQTNKGADFNIAFNLLAQLEQRIAQAFLMLSGQIRDSERTTATEVRATVNELEAALGGVFSTLAAEFQTPLVRLLLQELNPDVLKVSDVSITTGVSAISREKDFQNLTVMLQSIAQFGPEVIQQYLDVGGYLTKVATSLGMDPKDIVKSEEQRQKEQQQAMAQQQQMMAAQAGMQAASQTQTQQ